MKGQQSIAYLSESQILLKEEDCVFASRVVTILAVIWTVNSFSPYKFSKEDGIFQSYSKKRLKIKLPVLVKLLRMSLVWSYIPLIWLTARVVYISKANLMNNSLPNFFLSIHVTSFILKTLDRYIREENLRNNPLNFH